MGVCGAADVLEERRVVDVGRQRGADVLGDAGRDHGGSRRLAGLEAHADVGDQRQPDQELGQSDPRLVHGRSISDSSVDSSRDIV